MSYVVPRFRSSVVRTVRVPVVEHPSARMGRTEDLTVCGTPTPFLRREKTFAGYPSVGDVHFTIEDDSPRLLQYPPEYLQKPGRMKVKFQETAYMKGSSDFELLDVIHEKIASGFYGLKHMFRSNDPTGQGNVSKEALLRILYNLCGYITREQFEKVIKRLGLEKLSTISFDRFISCFKDNETVQREWVKNVSISENPPQWDSTPAYAIAALREKLQNGKVDIHNILPGACFQPGGYVVPPQLREALAQIGIRLTDTDFTKLWIRFDRQNVGALPTTQVFRELDLDVKGQPKFISMSLRNEINPNPTMRHRSEVTTSRTDWVDKYTEDPQSGNINLQRTKSTVHQTEKKVETTESTEYPPNTEIVELKPRPLKTYLKPQPKFDNIIDHLHYKISSYLDEFENAYHSLLAAFKLFDSMNDGYVARVDFRQVLQQFGFNIAAVDLEHFLSRAGLRCIQGLVNYRDFLSRYQSCSENSLTSQVMSDEKHYFQKNGYPGERLSAEELEAKVVEFLHADFIKLLAHFRSLDKTNIGVVSQYDFRRALEKSVGYQMSDAQWIQLKNDLGLGTSGALVNYQQFLQRYDIEPGSWNRREGAFTVPRYPNVFTPPPQLDILRERAKTYHPVMETKVYAEGLRPVLEMERLVHELFKRSFHTFDKHFNEMDRKVTGRMTKWQFGALLKLTGLTLSTRELDQLWISMPVEPDNMFSYSSLLQHFNHAQKIPHPPAPRKVCYEDNSAMLETARRVQQDRKEKEKLADLERIAKRAEMERLQKEREAELAAKKAEKERKLKEKKGLRCTTPIDTVRMDQLAKAKLNMIYQDRLTALLQKIKPQVQNQRDYLKTYFQARDRMGFSHIGTAEMKGVMDRLYFNLLEDEKMEVCQHFDVNCNGRFHYVKFMEAFNGMPNASETVNQSSKFNQPLQRKLLNEWKNLRRAFKKYDKNNDGLLELSDLKKVLRSCGIPFNDQDLYHIISEFDTNMDGKISYDEFLKTLLTH